MTISQDHVFAFKCSGYGGCSSYLWYLMPYRTQARWVYLELEAVRGVAPITITLPSGITYLVTRTKKGRFGLQVERAQAITLPPGCG